jgi:hypothetical protein
MGRERLFEAAVIFTESLWFFAFSSVFAAWFADAEGPPFWVTLLTAAGAFYLVRLLGRLDISLTTMRALGLGVSLLGLYALLRLAYLDNLNLWDLSWLGHFIDHPDTARNTVVVGSLLTFTLWLRWAMQGQNAVTFDTAVASFSVGFVLAVVAVLIDVAADDFNSAADETIVPFFAVGLLTLAVFRIGQTASDEEPTPLDRPWVFASLGMIGLMVLLAAPAWLIGSVDAGPVLEPTGEVIAWTLDGVFRVLIVPVGLFFELMAWLVNRVTGDNVFEPPQITEALEQTPEERESNPSFPFLIIGRFIAGLIVTGLVTALAFAIFSRLGRRQRERGELRESIWHEGSLFEDVGDLLGKLFAQRRRRSTQPPDLAADLLAVRRLYLEVLERAEDRGLERPPAKTPLEFAPPLAEHFGSMAPGKVSRAFARARYGLKSVPSAELEQLRRKWREANR